MVNLSRKQRLFSIWYARLILRAIEMGYEVTLGETLRPDFTAKHYEELGKGIDNSNHRIKIAGDLNLFRDGQYLSKTEDYRPLGEWWKSQIEPGVTFCWGGDFDDGDHFSFEHQGIR